MDLIIHPSVNDASPVYTLSAVIQYTETGSWKTRKKKKGNHLKL
jgi:hypothetical protein